MLSATATFCPHRPFSSCPTASWWWSSTLEQETRIPGGVSIFHGREWTLTPWEPSTCPPSPLRCKGSSNTQSWNITNQTWLQLGSWKPCPLNKQLDRTSASTTFSLRRAAVRQIHAFVMPWFCTRLQRAEFWMRRSDFVGNELPHFSAISNPDLSLHFSPISKLRQASREGLRWRIIQPTRWLRHQPQPPRPQLQVVPHQVCCILLVHEEEKDIGNLVDK